MKCVVVIEGLEIGCGLSYGQRDHVGKLICNLYKVKSNCSYFKRRDEREAGGGQRVVFVFGPIKNQIYKKGIFRREAGQRNVHFCI